MARAVLSVLLLFVARTSCLDEDQGMWRPADSVQALDSVIAAVDKVVKNPHLSAEQLKQANQVAEDVKSDIEAVEHGKLAKPEASKKIQAAIEELSTFQWELIRSGNPEQRIAAINHMLDVKQAQMNKKAEEIKLFHLQADLDLKKEQLESTIQAKKLEEVRRNFTHFMNKNMAELAKQEPSLPGAHLKHVREKEKLQEMPAPLKAVYAKIKAQDFVVSDELAKIDVQQNKSDAVMDVSIQQRFPTMGKDDAIVKTQKTLELLKGQIHRKFAKARAEKQAELKELKDAEVSIEDRDVKGLRSILAKVKSESHALQAKSGGFLH